MASWAQSDDDPLHQLRAGHPRLILLDSDLDRLKALIRDHPLARRIYLDLEKESDRLLTTPVSEYRLVGPRLRAQTRRVLDRVSTLALMYRLTGRETYQKRAVAELRAGAGFRDWNPAIFPDTADMAHAFALGYDWLYRRLFSHASIWRRKPATVTAALTYLAGCYLYKRSNRLWHFLIKRRLVRLVWRPLVELTRRRHVAFRKRLRGAGRADAEPATLRDSRNLVPAGV
jgi:hypothetical protein